MGKKLKGYSTSGLYHVTWVENSEYTPNIETADYIVMPGGGDVHPSLYSEKEHRMTSATIGTDLHQMRAISAGIALNIPIIGICRGIQLIHVYAGGKLFQHVTGHTGAGHELLLDTGKTLAVNSIHHQMVNLDTLTVGEDYHLIGWARTSKSQKYEINDQEAITEGILEPEIVYYKKINALGFQWHPEMMTKGCPAVQYASELVHKMIEGNGSKPFWNI